MIPIVTPAEMAAIDAAAPEDTDVLIARAGAEVAIVARRMMGGTYGRRVLVASGKGNNGADGRVAAVVLERWGVRCEVATPLEALELVTAANAQSARLRNRRPGPWTLVIDAAYGTGLRGPWGADEPPPAPVLAVDIPSGVDALTGTDHGCWPARTTVTFGALKPGLVLQPGAGAAGEVRLAPIGLDATGAHSWLATDSDAAAALPHMPATAHKWQRAVRVIAGSAQMRGAGYLVCAAAQQAGAGMVVISSPGIGAEAIERPTEAIARDLSVVGDDGDSGAGRWAAAALVDIERFHAAVIGPGIGMQDTKMAEAARFIEACPVPLVVDADALEAVRRHPGCVAARTAPTVLTPHDGEFSRLTGAAPAADRIASVRQAACALRATVLLKGPTTLVASGAPAASAPCAPSVVIAVRAGSQRLATAGSGDVLAGVIAAVLAHRGSPADGAWVDDDVTHDVAAAAHWHGRTAALDKNDDAASFGPLAASRQVALLAETRADLMRQAP